MNRVIRRRPRQRRSIRTVEAILDAVTDVLVHDGVKAVTTNRIAEAAGLSIGSIYQYFPDKQAIFAALHQRHVEEVDRLVETTLLENASEPLEEMMGAILKAMINVHVDNSKLFTLLFNEVPHRTGGSHEFAVRVHGAFRLAVSSQLAGPRARRDLDRIAFVLASLVESLSHSVVLRRPPILSINDAKEEALRAVRAYIRAIKQPAEAGSRRAGRGGEGLQRGSRRS